MGEKEFKERERMTNVVEKQVRIKKQEQVDEEFLALMDESIEKDKRLPKRLAKA